MHISKPYSAALLQIRTVQYKPHKLSFAALVLLAIGRIRAVTVDMLALSWRNQEIRKKGLSREAPVLNLRGKAQLPRGEWEIPRGACEVHPRVVTEACIAPCFEAFSSVEPYIRDPGHSTAMQLQREDHTALGVVFGAFLGEFMKPRRGLRLCIVTRHIVCSANSQVAPFTYSSCVQGLRS